MIRFKAVTMLFCLFCMLPFCATPKAEGAAEDYWPTWRGPNQQAVSLKGNPPVTWSESKNIKWKIEFPGRSTSSPVIWENKLFFLTAVPVQKSAGSAGSAGSAETKTLQSQPAEQSRRPRGRGRRRGSMSRSPSSVLNFDVVCLDRRNGKTLWQKTARKELPHEGHHPDHGFASYSPVTDGKYVWASFGSRGLYCFDMNGQLKWNKDLIKMTARHGFGEGSSPAIVGDAIVVVADHEKDSYIFAFNKITGKLLWKKSRDEVTSWATPVGVEVNGKLQVIVNATTFIRSYDIKTGDVIWKCSGQTVNVVPTPVIGFGKVYCTSGYRGNILQAIELGKTGDLTGSEAISWQVNEATPYVPSPLLYKGRIYFGSSNRASFSCYEAERGKPLFTKQSLEGLRGIYASPVGAAGRVYIAGRRGATIVLKCSDKFEVLATNTLDDGFDASPAVVGNEIYLKGNKYLYCIATEK